MDGRVLAAAGLVAGALLAPQEPKQPQQPPTFKTGAELVRVDVTVTDRSGKPVTNLTAADFVIFEDDVPQKIQTFQLIEFNGEHGPDEDLTLTIGPRDNRNDQLAREDVRLILVFWDEYHIHPHFQEKFLKDALEKFLRTMLNPTDLVAIMDPWTPMSDLWFSRDRYRLTTQLSALQGRQGILIPRNAAEENHFRFQNRVPFVREQVSLTALKSAFAHLGTLREGRKTLLYVSQEFGLGRDTNRWAMEMMEAANAANVAFYSINPEGLQVNRSNFRSGLLASIAYETGGESFVSNVPELSMQRALTQSSAAYLLGYAPSPLRHDGKYHKIEVKVRGGGRQVRARNGYFAPSAAEKEAARAAAKEAELPSPIEAAFGELAWVGRPETDEAPKAVRTIFDPETPSPALSLAAPAVWVVNRPADLKAAQGDTPPPPYAGRQFVRTDRILVAASALGEQAFGATLVARLIDRRGKPRTELPFSKTANGWVIDFPLQSIARGDYLIALEATSGEHRAVAYVPIRIAEKKF